MSIGFEYLLDRLKRQISLLMLLQLFFFSTAAQDTLVWQVFDSQQQLLVPYTEDIPNQNHLFYLIIDKQISTQGWVMALAPWHELLVNDQPWQVDNASANNSIEITSLLTKAIADTTIITLVCSDCSCSPPHIQHQSVEANAITLITSNDTHESYYFILLSISMLVFCSLVAFLRLNQLSLFILDKRLITQSKNYLFIILSTLILLAFSISIWWEIYLYGQGNFTVPPDANGTIFLLTIAPKIGIVGLFLASIICIAFFLKEVSTFIAVWRIYFNISIQLSIYLMIALMGFSSLALLGKIQFFFFNLKYVVIFLLIARIFVLISRINNTRQLSNIQLFSYLCATEIIPFFLVLSILL